MKKQATKGMILIITIVLFVPFLGFAQDADKPNTVTAVTLTIDPEADGTIAEFDSLTALYDANVISKNKFIKSEIRLGHYYGSKSGEFIIITEYNGSGLAIIEKAGKEDSKLFKKWKKDDDERAEFNKAFNKYFKPWHSDEIYTLMGKVTN